MDSIKNETPEVPAVHKKPESFLTNIYDIVEVFGTVTVFIILIFAFVARLNIVSGHSMDTTLYGGKPNGTNKYVGGEWLVVSDLFYEPAQGDIIVLHDMEAKPYDEPIVKRVIATGGQTVDIDFENWKVTVDGKVLDESSYIHLEGANYVSPNYSYPLTLGEDEIFVMGDNRNVSADSRIFGPVDRRCIVGKALLRIYPLSRLTLFKNPFTGK